MNKKGFTLIELLAVIIVIGLLGAILVPVTTNIIRATKERSYEQQINFIMIGANNWLTENAVLLNKEGVNCISIETIKEAEFLDDNDIIDPRDNSVINGYIKFTYNTSYNQYNKEYVDTCNE